MELYHLKMLKIWLKKAHDPKTRKSIYDIIVEQDASTHHHLSAIEVLDLQDTTKRGDACTEKKITWIPSLRTQGKLPQSQISKRV